VIGECGCSAKIPVILGRIIVCGVPTVPTRARRSEARMRVRMSYMTSVGSLLTGARVSIMARNLRRERRRTRQNGDRDPRRICDRSMTHLVGTRMQHRSYGRLLSAYTDHD